MSPVSKREYLEAIFLRYKGASRQLKTIILNEFCTTWGNERCNERCQALIFDLKSRVRYEFNSQGLTPFRLDTF